MHTPTVRPLGVADTGWARAVLTERWGGEVAVHRNAVDRSRELKPSIPLVGSNGIPIRHEVELELLIP